MKINLAYFSERGQTILENSEFCTFVRFGEMVEMSETEFLEQLRINGVIK